MPITDVIIFQKDDKSIPLLGWLDKLPGKVHEKCIVKIQRLEKMGYELHRPDADILRNGIYELRVPFRGIQYRMLYFFHDKQAVLSHGLIKESVVPPKEIDLAIEHRAQFESDPQKHTYRETLP